MRSRLAILADPMVVMLVLATGFAVLLPVAGEARTAAQQVSNVAIFVLFLVNGMRVPRGDIARGLANWRFFLPLTLFVFGAMALMGLGLSRLASLTLPPLVALGFVFLGTLPSTVQSATSYSTLAGGNVALSVIGAALLNILGVFVTAPLFALLGGGEAVAAGSDVIVKIGLILVLPFAIGQVVQGWTGEWVKSHKSKIVWLDRGIIALAVYVAISGAVSQGLLGDLDAESWAWLVATVVLFLALANIAAWIGARMLRYPLPDRISFLFAGSQKSVAIGAPLAAILFPPTTAGFVIAPLLLDHLLQLVLAAPLATRLARLARN